jgi:hypothetical protein
VHLLETERIDVLLAHTLAGYNRYEVKQFMRVQHLLNPDEPDALAPEKPKRRPRKGRLPRFEDLSPNTHPPPGSGRA